MAPKDRCDPEEGIIELFDIVDGPEDEPEKTPEAPDAPASEAASPETPAPEQARQPEEGAGESGRTLSRYPFENGPDFLDELGKTPNLTFLPPRAESDGAEAGGPQEGGDEAADGPDGLGEPDEALVRAFEAEMAKAGGSAGDVPAEDGPAVSGPGEALDAVGGCNGRMAADVVPPEAEAAALASPDAVPPAEEADGEEPGTPLPFEPPLPSCLSPAAEAAPAEDKSGFSGVAEERITRLEEALSRLSERVAALEQHVDEAGTEASGPALSEAIEAVSKEKDALRGEMRALSPEGGAPEEEAAEAFSSVLSEPRPAPEAVPFSVVHESASSDEGPDLLGLALESLEQRVALLERRPALMPDVAGIAQDVLALVRVDMEKAAEEQEAASRTVEDLQRRVQELEKRPLPQLILPELPDAEAISAEVMSRIRADLDRITAETAARVLREEIARLMGK